MLVLGRVSDTWPCLHCASLLAHSLTVTGSQPLTSKPALEASRAVPSLATMRAATLPCPPTSSYSSPLPSPPHTTPSARHHGPSTELANLDNGCSSKQAGGASCDTALLASCSCRSHAYELHTTASSMPATDLRAGVELHNDKPPLV
jgi:hypothetical protein